MSIQNPENLDDLYLELGEALEEIEGGALGSGPSSDKDKIERAIGWFETERLRLQNLICKDQSIRTLKTTPQTDIELLVQTIADSIAAAFTMVPCVTIARIVVLNGLDRFCLDIQPDEEAEN